MKRVLITGATGFLGRYAVDEFLRAGYQVVAVGRNADKLQHLQAKRVRTVQADLAELSRLSEPVDYVIHAAALSTIWGKWGEFYDSNVVGTQYVIDFCMANQVKKLIYVSSPSIYSGRADRLDITEDDYDPANSLNDYIRSKIMAEKLVRSAYEQGLRTVIIRPRGLFGVGDTSLVPRLLRANQTIGLPLFNGGRNLVDVTCVENVALALRLAVERDQANGNVYNITNGEPREFRAILEALFAGLHLRPRYLHVSLPVMYNAARATERAYKLLRLAAEPPLTKYAICTLGYSQTLDISRAIRDIGYASVMTLDDGIKKYASDYHRQRQ